MTSRRRRRACWPRAPARFRVARTLGRNDPSTAIDFSREYQVRRMANSEGLAYPKSKPHSSSPPPTKTSPTRPVRSTLLSTIPRATPTSCRNTARSFGRLAPEGELVGACITREAQRHVKAELDESFFRVRAERTAELELEYLRAMEKLGRGEQTAGDVATVMGPRLRPARPRPGTPDRQRPHLHDRARPRRLHRPSIRPLHAPQLRTRTSRPAALADVIATPPTDARSRHRPRKGRSASARRLWLFSASAEAGDHRRAMLSNAQGQSPIKSNRPGQDALEVVRLDRLE